MYILIDTNAVNADLRLKNAGIIKLAAKAKKQGYKLCFPKVVIEEMIKHHQENIDRALKDLRKSGKILYDDTGSTLIDDKRMKEVERAAKKYRIELRTRIKDLDGVILNLPSKDQQSEILKKAVLRKKPFKGNGAGYPDASIWGNIMEIASKFAEHPTISKPRIIFVSNNHTDFCNSDKFDLHDELVDELEDIGVGKKAVMVVKNLEDASGHLLVHSDAIVSEEASALFLTREHEKSDLKRSLEKYILEHLPFKSLDNDEIGIGDTLEDPTIDMVHEDYTYKDVIAEILSEDQISVTLKVSVTCLLDVYVTKSEAMYMEGLSKYDNDWNNHYVAAQIEKEIWFKLSIITDSNFQELLSCDIEADEESNNEDY